MASQTVLAERVHGLADPELIAGGRLLKLRSYFQAPKYYLPIVSKLKEEVFVFRPEILSAAQNTIDVLTDGDTQNLILVGVHARRTDMQGHYESMTVIRQVFAK